ncbi:MAG: TraR/DksA family transcriptional regulator [Myxococcales bacterium]|jgi:DnaK suppressor protein
MDERTRERFRQRLQRRRRELVAARHAAEQGVVEVREGRTDPEYEEAAQADHVEYTLREFSDARRRELLQVDAALARLDAGIYGTCVECGGPIELDRLEALPYALRCADDALRDEREERGGVRRAPYTL